MGLDMSEQLDVKCIPVTETGCWIWLGRTKPARRLAWRLRYGRINLGYVLARDCSMEDCINPDHHHLEPK